MEGQWSLIPSPCAGTIDLHQRAGGVCWASCSRELWLLLPFQPRLGAQHPSQMPRPDQGQQRTAGQSLGSSRSLDTSANSLSCLVYIWLLPNKACDSELASDQADSSLAHGLGGIGNTCSLWLASREGDRLVPNLPSSTVLFLCLRDPNALRRASVCS